MADPKSECERLMNALVPFAEQMLTQYGEFFPYGGAIDRDGKIVGIATNAGSERPTSDEVMSALKVQLRAGAASGEFQATGVVFDVRIPLPGTGEKSDAIAVALDHKDDYSVTVFFAYAREEKSVVIGDVFASGGRDEIFSRRKNDQ